MAKTVGMSAPLSARELVRTEMTRQILEVAREHLARDGAAGLALRSIARELEMVPSALYRYFPSRDALLSALILDAYEALLREAERASENAWEAETDDVERWLAVPRAMRIWALENPHQWALLFGSPVPGYEAPQSTVAPYARLAEALVRPIADAHVHGRLHTGPATKEPSGPLEAALQPVIDGLLPGVPAQTVASALQAWATLIGVVSLEMFGHWRNTVLDPEVFFESTIANLANLIGLRARR